MKSIKSEENSPLLAANIQPPNYVSIPCTPALSSSSASLSHSYPSKPSLESYDIEAMFKSTWSHPRSKPMLLLGSAGATLLLICLCAFSRHVEAASIARSVMGMGSPLDFEKREVTVDYACQRMLANIGGTSPSIGTNQVPGVLAGSVIASPSTWSPNYFYSWVRDASLTMKVVVSQPDLDRNLMTQFAHSVKVHQQNADSSSVTQGEPKFNTDGSLFTGPWGRPQNDGPALRSSVLMTFAKRIGLNDPFVTDTLYKSTLPANSLIKTDLEYVAHHWQDNCFDLWEEVNARHFFTLNVQRRALLDGAKFANSMNDPGAATYYNQQASSIQTALESFWDSDNNFLRAYQGVSYRSGVDCSTLLGSLKGWDTNDMDAAVDATQFGPASDKVLATHKKYVDAFRSLYSINQNAAAPASVATGRYPEDIYDGVGTSAGNPWYICTLASAEIVNTAVDVANQLGSINVTPISLPFYQQFSSSIAAGSYSSSSSQFTTLTNGMKAMAKGFVDIVQTHSWQNGSLNEEFNRDNGFNQGARDLTWSYAAFVTNDMAQNNQFLLN